jgi:hypothetical protein
MNPMDFVLSQVVVVIHSELISHLCSIVQFRSLSCTPSFSLSRYRSERSLLWTSQSPLPGNIWGQPPYQVDLYL